MKKRLQAIEGKAARSFTSSEILGMVREVFRIADKTVSEPSRTNFKTEVIGILNREMEIDAGELREVLL